jgi:hypothetical protein
MSWGYPPAIQGVEPAVMGIYHTGAWVYGGMIERGSPIDGCFNRKSPMEMEDN